MLVLYHFISYSHNFAAKLLKKIIILKKVKHILITVLLGLITSCGGFVYGQNTVVKDTLQPIKQDSVTANDLINKLANFDSVATPIIVKDTIAQDSISFRRDSTGKLIPVKDSLQMDSLKIENEKGDIPTTIYYTADDSIMVDVKSKTAYLYGNAHIKNGDVSIKAERIEIDWVNNVVMARGKVDSTGRYRGKAVFSQKTDVYVTDSMKYNIKTQKGIIHGIQTKQGEGFLHGDTAKRTEEAIYMKQGKYTTCNLEHPHFYISAKKLKVIPEDKAVSGPFHMVIEDVHTPVGFWMGFFPIMDKKKSGLIIPNPGQGLSRGFYLDQGGYYWALSDYVGIKFLGSVWANGSWLANLSTKDYGYLKRYKFSGAVDFTLSRVKEGFDDAPLNSNFLFKWSHRSIAKKNSNFSASVDLSSGRFYVSNSFNPTLSQQNITNSTVNYGKQFGKTPFRMGLSLNINQNMSTAVATGQNASAVYSGTLPDLNFSMNRISPFKKKGSSGNRWYEKIFINYDGGARYTLTNTIPVFNPQYPNGRKDSTFEINNNNLNKYILANGKLSARHQTTATINLKLFKFISVNPNINYTEYWYDRKYDYAYDPVQKKGVISDTVKGFFRNYTYSAGVSMSTILYGTYQFKGKTLKAIRHMMTPTLAYSYSPDFSDYKYGGWQQVNQETINGKSVRYSHFAGLGYGSAGNTTISSITFGLSNVLEAKVRNKKDTSGANPLKKINLLDNFGVNGSYNFAADSVKLSNITFNARTRIFNNKIDINLSGTFDPYMWRADSVTTINGQKYFYNNRRVNTFALQAGKGLARLTNLQLSVGTNLNPKAKKKPDPKTNNVGEQRELDYIKSNPEKYVDFKIPWSLNVRYNLAYIVNNYSITNNNSSSILKGSEVTDATFNQNISLTGDIKLTEKWKVGLTSGFDIKQKSITNTNVNIFRDLHCWQMSMALSLFGTYQAYTFSISAKSSLLQQLHLNKRSPTYIQ